MLSILSTRTLVLTLICLFCASCNPSNDADPVGIDHFAFGEGPESGLDCTDCPPTVVDMCLLRTNTEVLLFVEVQASDYVRDECEKRAYRSSHYQQTLRILGVAAGTFAGQTIEVVAVDAMGVATQVGDLAVVGATNIDGVWFATGRVPIEMVASDAVPVDHVRSSVSRIVYDLPTNFAEFSQQAETVWADYPTACGLPQPEGERADSELRSLFYDKDCPEIPVGENSNEEVVDGPTDVSP